MNLKFNLQFFGGGGTETTTIPKRDPEPEELTNLRLGLYQKVAPGLESYDVKNWQNAQNITNQVLNAQSSLIGQLTGDKGALSQNNTLANELASIARTGNIPSGVSDRLNSSVNQDLQSSMGTMLNNLASRGVLNSSVTTTGTNQLSQAAADAFNRNYMTAYNAVLGGLGTALQSGQNNTAAMLSAIGTLGNIPSQAYEAAGAGLTPALNLWKAWQSSYDNREDYDTVVKQGK